MSFNLTGGNPLAHRIRVYFEGTDTILEGMPLCYNYDTTDNWFGGSMTLGAVTETSTTAEGSQNEGKYIRCELPANGNLIHFAGVVAKGSPGIGAAGPCAIDVYVPNGAIVPVLCDVDTTTGRTVLSIAEGQEELGCSNGTATSRPVGIAMETETALDGTADITLCKLDPNLFLYASMDGTALDLGLGYTLTDQYVTSAITTQFLPFQVRSALTGTGAGGMIGAKYTTECAGTACVGDVYGLWSQAAVTSGGAVSSAGKLVGMWAKTHTATDTGTLACPIYGIQISMYNGTATTGNTAMMYFDVGTAVAETVDYWFISYADGPGCSIAYTADTTGTNQAGAIKVLIGATTGYIPVYDQVAVP